MFRSRDTQLPLTKNECHNFIDTIEHIDAQSMDVPVNEFDGKVVYGEKNVLGTNKILTGHYREMIPTLRNLRSLEKSAQGSFLDLVNRSQGMHKHW